MNLVKFSVFAAVVVFSLFALTFFVSHYTVSAQTSSNLQPNVTANTIPSQVQVIPYHPRDPLAYAAEKKQLDDITRNWLATHPQPSPSSHKFLGPLSPVNVNPLGFDGHNAASSGGFDPPDVQMAVGPNHVMELVNVKGEIWNKAGVSLQNVTLTSFFRFSSSANLGDPKILFDNMSGTNGRWFASILDLDNNTVGIAVSQTNDPTGSWYKFHDGTYGGECPDQPKMGISDDKLVISSNDFGDSPSNNCRNANGFSDGAEYHVFDKTKLITGVISVQSSGVRASEFATTPVQSLSSTSPLYMVSDGGVSSTNQIKLFNLTGQVGSVNFNNINILTVRTINTAPSALQPVTTTLLDTGDTRILDAAWFKGNLWFSLDDGCTPTGDTIKRSCVRLIQFNTNTTKVIQDFDINATNTYYYYPALRLDGFGGLGVVFGTSNSTDPTGYPSLIVTGQAAHDPINSFKQLSYLKIGSQYEDDNPNLQGVTRYGDYFGAALDPSDSSRVWVAGEYNKLPPGHTKPTWSTFISSINFDCIPPTTAGTDWTISASCTLAKSATAPANVIVQPNAVLTIPNGISLNIDFTQFHLKVNPGGGVFIAPGGKIT